MGLMTKKDKIFVAGHKGLAGSAIVETLRQNGYNNIITKTRSELDLLNTLDVNNFFSKEKPNIIILSAAKVGGIHANNTYRADFIYQNLQIQNNVIWAAHENNVHRLIFLGSSCIYPKECPQPIKEEYLLTGKLEYTNQPYAIAKIAGIELINSLRKQYGRDYFCAMPTNLFGPHDNFHPENSHVLPALIRKFCEAKELNLSEVVVWGDGTPLREFMYSMELGNAISYLANNISFEELENSIIGHQGLCHINIGTGYEISIKELAKTIAFTVGFKGCVSFDSRKPNGTPRKRMDSSFINSLGWKANLNFEECIKISVDWYLSNTFKT
ncbi:GDP-L-fucose synthase [Fluviispira sanaruensis]|uniref:GDP-L-fucose synthase n=2 Tax=Fluviispira sanaruensis TaxID=2493639 RepID=A0A4P2VM71_FLUSA|nr:GDP-L-fucose synthase [Fluviispira sanaruensis]